MDLFSDIKHKIEDLADNNQVVASYAAVLTHDDVVNCSGYNDADDNALDMLQTMHHHPNLLAK
jgi:hypothetical protein